jgi:hypothetical protein
MDASAATSLVPNNVTGPIEVLLKVNSMFLGDVVNAAVPNPMMIMFTEKVARRVDK